MADFTAFIFPTNFTYNVTYAFPYSAQAEMINYNQSVSEAESGALPIYTYYLMRWQDVNSSSITYRIWTVVDNPDPTGIFYTGPKSGGAAISGAVVVGTWNEAG